MDKLRFISVQPRLMYYAWQVEVMINNFVKHNINPNNIDVLVATNENDATSNIENIDAWLKLERAYPLVNFYYYPDTREDNGHYIPSIYFNIMKQHYSAFPALTSTTIFAHDSDIIFTKPVDFSALLNDNVWYLSNTNSYINYDYIVGKGEDVYKGMCNIIGIDPIIPKIMNSNSGGAQHIIKNATSDFWHVVENDSINLYKWFCHVEPQWTRKDYPIQKWTAGMWALLWNMWMFGHETKVVPELDFCMATDSIKRWDEVSIFHNAGVTGPGQMFYKGQYQTVTPYNLDLKLNEKLCSYNYYKEIQSIEKQSTL